MKKFVALNLQLDSLVTAAYQISLQLDSLVTAAYQISSIHYSTFFFFLKKKKEKKNSSPLESLKINKFNMEIISPFGNPLYPNLFMKFVEILADRPCLVIRIEARHILIQLLALLYPMSMGRAIVGGGDSAPHPPQIFFFFLIQYIYCKGGFWFLSPNGGRFRLKKPNTINLQKVGLKARLQLIKQHAQ